MIKNFILLLVLVIFAASLAEAKTVDPILPMESPLISIERCMNGIIYYMTTSYGFNGPQGYGYGFMVPKIDKETLKFVRCDHEHLEIIKEKPCKHF